MGEAPLLGRSPEQTMGLEPAITRLDEHLETHALSLEILNHLRDPHSAFVHWRARNISTHHVFDSIERAYRYWGTTWIHEENHEPWCRYFGLDLQMLLAVAVDSSWFTSQQHSQLEEMLKDVVCGSEMKSSTLDIAGLKTVLASKEEHLGQLKRALGERDKEVASLREELSELQARVQGAIDSLHLGLRVQVNSSGMPVSDPASGQTAAGLRMLNNQVPGPTPHS